MEKPSWIGKTIGNRYKIDAILGQGGMSAVYKATDPNLRRVVAIKLIHGHLSDDPKFLSRFEEEAAAVAQLRHPNIVQVYDFDHDEDTYYMVMEFIPGETLQDRLRRLNKSNRRLTPAEAIKITMQTCDAIGYAHQRGMVHRDIKPANIMLDVQGQAILMDFGIVKIVGGERHTATGAVVGTALYMSPELIKGEVPDQRADIYSLGVTLFEMVNGRPPYEADSAMTLMMMHLNDPIPDLRSLRPDVPPDLIGIIETSLSKSRSDRYQTATEMQAALQAVLERVESGASLPSTKLEQPPVGSGQTPYVSVGGTLVDTPQQSASVQSLPPRPPRSETTPPTYSTPAVPSPVYTTPVTPPQSSAEVRPPSSTSSINKTATATPALKKPALLAGGAVGLIAIICLLTVAVGFLAYNQFFAGKSQSAAEPTALETDSAVVVAANPTSTPTFTITPAPSATDTPPPTTTPTLAPASPTPSSVPTEAASATPMVRIGLSTWITNITIDDQNRYVVEYETYGFTEQLPGMHVHFYFNTVPPDQAGIPGSGPWILWGGPRPFKEYRVSDRPASATQMCVLVANEDHSVIQGSGNCVYLP